MEVISFTFRGGIADASELDFYEAGRFSYGAARLIYTLERFRQDRRVVRRLSRKVNADIRIRAAERGSFLQDVLIIAAPVIADCALQVSFQAIFSYAWNLLLPPARGQDVALQIANYKSELEKQKTEQERERTEQIRLMTEVANNNNATTQQALTILEHTLKNEPQAAVNATHLSIDELNARRDELNGFEQRRELSKEFRGQLDTIRPNEERTLTSQIRKPISDLALPLRSSAQSVDIGVAPGRSDYAKLRPESVRVIASESEDDTPTTLRVSIRMYDKETGYGKLYLPEIQRPISFRVLSALKHLLLDKITEAMREESVVITGYFIRDYYGSITSFILEGILDEEEVDQVHTFD